MHLSLQAGQRVHVKGFFGEWRVEGDTVFLDLNPKSRDNNLMMVLPIHGGRGHWGLSTFAGEVALSAIVSRLARSTTRNAAPLPAPPPPHYSSCRSWMTHAGQRSISSPSASAPSWG